jgi:hypothetical protein
MVPSRTLALFEFPLEVRRCGGRPGGGAWRGMLPTEETVSARVQKSGHGEPGAELWVWNIV